MQSECEPRTGCRTSCSRNSRVTGHTIRWLRAETRICPRTLTACGQTSEFKHRYLRASPALSAPIVFAIPAGLRPSAREPSIRRTNLPNSDPIVPFAFRAVHVPQLHVAELWRDRMPTCTTYRRQRVQGGE